MHKPKFGERFGVSVVGRADFSRGVVFAVGSAISFAIRRAQIYFADEIRPFALVKENSSHESKGTKTIMRNHASKLPTR